MEIFQAINQLTEIPDDKILGILTIYNIIPHTVLINIMPGYHMHCLLM